MILPTTSVPSFSFFLERYTIDDAAYFSPEPPPISLVGNIEPTTSYVWFVITIGTFALPSFRVNTLNAALSTCARVISRVSLPSAVSSTSFVVDNIPSESKHNNIGFLSASFCCKYASNTFNDCVLNSCTVVTGRITIRAGSIPLSITICFVIADSDSKYNTPASGFASRNDLTIPITKKVLPVADSPATAVILFAGSPP